jgi:hypothetical protein
MCHRLLAQRPQMNKIETDVMAVRFYRETASR